MAANLKTQTFITRMPDKPGAFMLATKIITKHQGNIIRVSFNKAVDFHMLFVEVRADEEALHNITKELLQIGYLENDISDSRVIVVNIKMKDEPGSLYPVLKILDRYDINISYINSNEEDGEYQNFKMGLLIENPALIKCVLDDISEIYPIDIITYAEEEPNLDNTIFYIRIGNEIQRLFDLSTEKTMEFICESNRVFQMLQDRGETPNKVFEYVLHLAKFMSKYRGERFQPDISRYQLTAKVALHVIEPPCGSNTYILEAADELLFIDTGFAIYAEEMLNIFQRLFPNFATLKKKILITHADVDHCGLLSVIDADIYLNEKSAQSFQKQRQNLMDFREENIFCLGYSRLSRIFSNYVPPDPARFKLIGEGVAKEHRELLQIGTFTFADLSLEIYEGSGGHLYGEMVFLCREPWLLFTGDIYINVKGLTKERSEFNSLAPYLMTSVNVNSQYAKEMRKAVFELLPEKQRCLICSGHGAVEIINDQ
ncbi:MBL fold metallo-hydrolase [Candidatus Methanomassiliicoccus intestinalis]|uniref:MBL fold metallo-hydrolase n=1 Tax=Candidatus Methanomassiliicoccus intestinalis TaxID=1406512 RepID=UPI0037DC24AF